MKVIITEKPSMKAKFEKALGKEKDIKVVSAIGHLAQLECPEFYIEKSEGLYWNELIEDLPVFPEKYKLKINNKEQIKTIEKSLKQADEIILACDPDREGEHIHRNIIEVLEEKNNSIKNNKNITRIWLHAETTQGIKEGFEKRKDYKKYEGYYLAARTRAIIDWLIGIQCTVLYSVKFGEPGMPVSIGRVQTWLLSEIIKRNRQNKDFKEETFYTINYTTKEGVKFNLIEYIEDNKERIKRYFNKQDAEKVSEKLKGKQLEIEKTEKTLYKEFAPYLYDLNSLSKDASKKYKISPEETLKIAQKLYEEKELISYPRTDCNVISQEEANEINKSWELVGKFKKYNKIYNKVKEINKNLKPASKFIGEIKGHFAIIPVFSYGQNSTPELNEKEEKIFDLIVKRLAGTLLPHEEGEKIKITGKIEDEIFLYRGKNIKNPGYKEYLNVEDDKKDDNNNIYKIDYKEGQRVEGSLEKIEDVTKAPKLFSDEMILQMMEKAHLYVENQTLAKYLKSANGIGTAATRSTYLPLLIKRDYIKKEKNVYIPSKKGEQVYNLLPEELKISDFSAQLEHELSKIEKKETEDTARLIKGTEKLVSKIFEDINNSEIKIEKEIHGDCPLCDGKIEKFKFGYICKNKEVCNFKINEKIANKKITQENIKKLLAKGKTDLIKGFKSKNGKGFDAYLKIGKENNIEFEFENKEKSGKAVGKCQSCGNNIVENDKGYGCKGYKDNGCKFYIAKNIAGKKMETKDIKQLIEKGESGIIKGFKSKKGKSFNAVLQIDKNNEIKFKFN